MGTVRYTGRLPNARRHQQRGFTLVELLIVIAILLTLAAIASINFLAALNRVRVARAVADVHSIGISRRFGEEWNGLGVESNPRQTSRKPTLKDFSFRILHARVT